MSKITKQGIREFIQNNPPSKSDLSYSFTYDNFLTSMENVFQSQRDLTAEEVKQAEEHNKNYKWDVSEWQKLDWDLIRQRINFRLKLDYIKERLQHAGRI